MEDSFAPDDDRDRTRDLTLGNHLPHGLPDSGETRRLHGGSNSQGYGPKKSKHGSEASGVHAVSQPKD
jgi:hypothetical protein